MISIKYFFNHFQFLNWTQIYFNMNHSKKTLGDFSKIANIIAISKSDKVKLKGGIGDDDMDTI
ncbi:MAG: hypothetical protein ACI85O_003537 [Saprospiraceae bacterium]|jgi:hypothetical protein